jgi:HlyD family secretion protein
MMIENTQAMDRPNERNRALSRRLLLVGLPIVVLVVLGWFVVPRVTRWMTTERSVELSRVRIGTVSRGDLQRDLSVQGVVVAAFHPTVFSPASGIVTLRVRAGEVVKAGQILAVLDSPELNSRLQQERSALSSRKAELDRQKIAAKQKLLARQQAVDLAQLELDTARRAMARAEASQQEGIINEIEFEKAEDDLQRTTLSLAHARQDAALERETLEFEIRNSEHDVEGQRLAVEELERQVGELSARAPVDGLVSRLDVNDRDAVNPGQPMITIVDLSAFEIELRIPESYVDEIGPGTPAIVRQGTDEFPGEVRSVSPEVDAGQVRAIVAFTDHTPDGLRQNQRVPTRLIMESKSGVLKVQRGPFLDNSGGRKAFVVLGDTAQLKEIRTGATSVTEVEILDGLEVGDRIIISDTARYGEAKRLYLRK